MKLDFNFLVSYRMNNKQLTMKSRVSYLITAMIILMIAIIAGTSMIMIGLNIKDSLYLTNLDVEIMALKEDSQEVIKMESQLAKLNQKKKAIDGVNAEITLNRMVNKQEIDTVFGALTEDTKVLATSYSKSYLVLECQATEKASPSLCAENLHKKGITATIGYGGYSSASKEATETEAGGTTVSFTVTCILTPKGGEVQ